MAQGGVPYRVNRAVGDYGEQVACRYLEAQGYEVLDRNWRCALGELDLVARRNGTLVFAEVKCRRSDRYGSPADAVTPAKAARLRRLAASWLGQRGVRADRLRIDVLAVRLPRSGPPRVEHLEGVA